MAELEDDLKLNNWLSILTFDAFKYAAAGGEMVAKWTDDGLTLVLTGVTSDHAGLNAKFRKMMERVEKEKAVQP